MPYDSQTNTFSPDGRLYQVEYAVESVGKAPTALGIVTSEGVVFAAERRQKTTLLDVERPEIRNLSGEKVYKIADHIAVAVAGMTADANHLIDASRRIAQRHTYTFGEPLPAEDLCQRLCDEKQSVTMSGGLRPYGIAFLIAAWDRHHGFQLYQTDPSGNYHAWKAYAIGQNDGTAQSMLKNDWKDTMTAREGVLMALKVLGKTMDTLTLNPERLEVSVLSRKKGESPSFTIMTEAELMPYIADAEALRKKEEEEKEAQRKARSSKD
jgi:20S proteasome subunit alpha 3